MVARGVVGTLIAVLLSAAVARAQTDEAGTIDFGGQARHFLLHRPGGGFAGPRPLIVSLPGRDMSVDAMRAWLPLEPVTDGKGVAIAYPEAIGGLWNYRPDPDGADDTGFISALLAKLVADGVADPKRVYLAGISRGALMTWRLMCARSDLFAAAAPLSSAMTEPVVSACHPSHVMPVLAEDGSADPIMAYDGWIPDPPAPRLLSVPETMEFWRRLHGCTGQTATRLPHREASDPTRVTRYEWTGCVSPVVLLKVTGGGHMPASFFPNSDQERAVVGRRGQDIETAAEVWRFFAAASARGG